MSWVVVPNLLEGRDQLNNRFPHRAKGAEGTIGDTSHKASPSSHNPDETGNPEYDDHDGVDEVRAADFDKNLNDEHGVSMEQVVQLWIGLARSGELWWVRYFIYAGRIWHRRDGFTTRKYTGSNQHYDHVHVNSDFTQAADTVTNTYWHLNNFGVGSVVVVGAPQPGLLAVDKELGPKTITRWQQIMHTPVDGKISKPKSDLIKAVQIRLNNQLHIGLVEDGELGPRTIRGLQRYLGTPQDGVISTPKSEVVGALQRRLNEGWF